MECTCSLCQSDLHQWHKYLSRTKAQIWLPVSVYHSRNFFLIFFFFEQSSSWHSWKGWMKVFQKSFFLLLIAFEALASETSNTAIVLELSLKSSPHAHSLFFSSLLAHAQTIKLTVKENHHMQCDFYQSVLLWGRAAGYVLILREFPKEVICFCVLCFFVCIFDVLSWNVSP